MNAIQWTKGINSSGGGKRALRIVMPLGMAIDVIERANMDSFVRKAGAVECRLDQLQGPDHPVYFLKDEPQEMRVKYVQSKFVHCKTVELPLNFHRVMVRYQFRTPGKGDLSRKEWLEKCSRYIKMWIELIIAEKRRQMHAPYEMWPSWIPWEVKTVWSMPIVLWLSKPKDRKGPVM